MHLSSKTRRKLSEANKGRHPSEETRQRMSKAQKGRQYTEESRRKMSEAHKGQRHSKETRRKLSEALKDRYFSEEHRQKISTAKKRHIVSEETRRKISKFHKGRHLSDEHRQKLSAVRKGHLVSDETRQKISLANKGHLVSDETRKKMSVAVKNQWSLIPKWKRRLITSSATKGMQCALEQMGISPSSLERAIHQHLNKVGVIFEAQKEFPPYFVDIWIPELNLAVECDGTYWHNNPGSRKRDQKRDHYLISRYKICIVRVPEKSIRSNPEQVVSEIVSGNLMQAVLI